LVASCVDARADALAQGVPVPPQLDALCGEVPAVTPDLVLRAFRELPLYRGGINTDPRGWTLVNLETYFWCGDAAGRSCAAIGEAERTVTLLGRQVRVRPRIVAYRWHFGDGVEQTVAGGAGRVAHVYRRQGTVAVRVTLTWTADFAVPGQPFQPIAGTTTTTSPPLAFPVRQARPVLVGGD
jgi:PKD domain